MAHALTPTLKTKAFVLRTLIGSASRDLRAVLQSSMVAGSGEGKVSQGGHLIGGLKLLKVNH
jgi:hypothetical protein